MAEEAVSGADGTGEGVRRRDFINVAAVSAAGVGAVGVLVPLVSQMSPSADVLAESSTEADISAIKPGQGVVVVYRKQPLFIRRLTPAEIAEVNKVDAKSLRDPQRLEDRTKPGKAEWMVNMGVCTHLGCVPIGNEGEFAVVEGTEKHGGWFCPCHGSQYDTAGRIRKGPAPENLHIPQYAYLSDTKIRIG